LALNRDLLLVGGGRLAATLLALVSIRAVTTFLSPEQYGELMLLMTVLTFCGLFFINPVGQHINLHTHAWWDDGTLISRLKSFGFYIAIVAAIGFIVILAMKNQNDLASQLWTAVAMFAMVLAYTWNSTLVPMLNQLGFRAASVTWGVITAAAGLLASLSLTLWLPSATAWFLGQFVGMALGAVGANRILRRHAIESDASSDKIPLLNKKVVLHYCLPLAMATGLMWLQLSGYRFLIDGYWGLTQLGFLAVGLQVSGQVLSVAEALAVQFLYPYFFRRVTVHENRVEVALAYSDLLNTLIPVYLVLTGVLFLSAPYLLQVLVSEKYKGAANLVMLGAGIDMCRMLGNLLSNAAHAIRQTKYLSIPYAFGAMTSLVSIFLVGKFQLPIEWAAYGLLFGGTAMLLVMAFTMHRQINFRLDLLRNAIALGVMLLMCAGSFEMPASAGIGRSIGILMAIGACSFLIIFAMLRHNPATVRLLNAQLRKS
jgi:O-antigen/teichoic acid export membrane protein